MPLYWKAIGKERFQMKSVLNFAGTYIYENKRNNSKFSQVIEQGFGKMLKSYIILTCIILTSMGAVSFGPMYIFFTQGQWITPLGIQFPFADVSDVAFFLDLMVQIVIAFIGILTTVSIEMVQVIINNAVELSSDVITLNINMLSDELEKNEKFTVETFARLRNVCIQIQDFDRYITNRKC